MLSGREKVLFEGDIPHFNPNKLFQLKERLISLAHAILEPLAARSVRLFLQRIPANAGLSVQELLGLLNKTPSVANNFGGALYWLYCDMVIDNWTLGTDLHSLQLSIATANDSVHFGVTIRKILEMGIEYVLQTELEIGIYDLYAQACFPMLMAFAGRGPNAAMFLPFQIRLRDPFGSLAMNHGISHNRQIICNRAISFQSIAKEYLSLRRTTNLKGEPPASTLRIFSDSVYFGSQLYSRRILGRFLGSLLLCSPDEEGVSLLALDYVSIKEIPKITPPQGAPSPTSNYPELTSLVSGLLTAREKYSDINLQHHRQLIKLLCTQALATTGMESGEESTLGLRRTGLIVGLGILGHFHRLPPVNLLALTSTGDKREEAGSLFAIAISNLGTDMPELSRILLLSIRRRVDELSEEFFDIDPAIRLTAPLALGLLHLGRGSNSISSFLLRTLTRYEVPLEKAPFPHDIYLINCGIALGLINLNLGRRTSECALLPGDLNRIAQALTVKSTKGKARGMTQSAKIALIFALGLTFMKSKNYKVIEILLSMERGLASKELSSFNLSLMVKISLALVRSPDPHSPSLAPSAIKDGLPLPTEQFLGFISNLLVASLFPDVAPAVAHLEQLRSQVLLIRQRMSTPAIAFHQRQERLILGVLHDLVILAWAASVSSLDLDSFGPRLTLFKLMSDHFSDHLDHHFGRSLIQSLALALLCMSSDQWAAWRGIPDERRVAFVLAAVLPIPPLEPDCNPGNIFRHLLPVSLFTDPSSVHRSASSAICNYGSGHHLTRLESWIDGVDMGEGSEPSQLMQMVYDTLAVAINSHCCDGGQILKLMAKIKLKAGKL